MNDVHNVTWIAAIVLAILALVGVDFPALAGAVILASVGELLSS